MYFELNCFIGGMSVIVGLVVLVIWFDMIWINMIGLEDMIRL